MGVVPRGEASCNPDGSAEGLPDLGRELGTPVRHDVGRQAMTRTDRTHLISRSAVSWAMDSLGDEVGNV